VVDETIVPDGAAEALARHDAYPFFDRVGGLIRTGPTGTNVADVRVVLVR
jgi:glycerate 2-kinase